MGAPETWDSTWQVGHGSCPRGACTLRACAQNVVGVVYSTDVCNGLRKERWCSPDVCNGLRKERWSSADDVCNGLRKELWCSADDVCNGLRKELWCSAGVCNGLRKERWCSTGWFKEETSPPAPLMSVMDSGRDGDKVVLHSCQLSMLLHTAH